MVNGKPKQKSARKALFFWMSGGEGGIRTRGEFYPTHAFQACDLNRSSTSPRQRAIVAVGLALAALAALGPLTGRSAGFAGLIGSGGSVGVALQVFEIDELQCAVVGALQDDGRGQIGL